MSLQAAQTFALRTLAGAAATLALAGAAQAQIVNYSGFDAGSSSIGPLSGAAAAAFDAAVGAHSTITFETAALPAGVTLSGDGTRANTFYGTPGSLYGFNTTAGGSYALSMYDATETFTFASGINAFGAYFTGVQIAGSKITFSDGTSQSLAIPGNFSNGGVAFVGFTDFGKSITSVTVNMSGDIAAIDDVRFAKVTAAVPEPETYALMLGGLGAMVWVARRRRPA